MPSDPKDEPKQRELGMPLRERSELARESDLLGGMIRLGDRETRRIAIGKKADEVRKSTGGGTWRAPMKLDHFIVTLKEQNEAGDFIRDDEMHKRIGEKPRQVPITFLYDRPSLNAHAYLGVYAGRTPWCKGNGTTALRLDPKTEEREPVKCPCNLLTEGKCKPHLVLQGRLPGMPVGEIAKFRTTSRRSMSYILSGLKRIMEITGPVLGLPWTQGLIANLPLHLVFQKETVTDKEGKQRTIPTVGVAYIGEQEKLEELAEGRKERYLRSVERQRVLEAEVNRKLLLPEDAKTAREIVEEFHPSHIDEVSDISQIPISEKDAEERTTENERREARKVLKEIEGGEGMLRALEEAPEDVLGEEDDAQAPPSKPRTHVQERPALPMRPERREAPKAPPAKKPAKPKDDGSFL